MKLSKFFSASILLMLGLLSINSAYAVNTLNGVRIWSAPESTRVVFDLKKSPDYSSFTLSNPARLVVDLKGAKAKLNFKAIKNNSKLVKRVRLSTPPRKGDLRVVIDLTHGVASNLFSLPATAPYGNRLVVDLDHGASKSATKSQSQSTTKSSITKAKPTKRDIIVALDPGHGGEDPGSIGPSGLYEKKVTLIIAKKVAKIINNTPGMKAVLTRTGDYYVGLNKRTVIAREKKADLFVSIHADAFTTPRPRGASVWVLSMRRANTEIGRFLEKKEQQSELLGGAGEIIQSASNEEYLARTLIDMSMDHSMALSHDVANDVLLYLRKVTILHKKHPESASLAVLKSPDIPSILVETGFISNHQEEKLLFQPKHQNNVANAIFKGIHRYFSANPPEGSLMANQKSIKHTVRRGESLSVIAHRYQVSIKQLKAANKLKSDQLRIGQNLVIPRA